MTVPTVGAGADPFAAYRIDEKTRTPELKQEMDKELFLQLLVAAVKYQDPSEPMKTQEMVQQTSTLSQMEQMVAMTKVSQAQYALSQRTAAASLVGAEIQYVADGGAATGVVRSVRMESENVFVDVGGREINLTDVTRVGMPGAMTGRGTGVATPAPDAPAAPATAGPQPAAPTTPAAPPAEPTASATAPPVAPTASATAPPAAPTASATAPPAAPTASATAPPAAPTASATAPADPAPTP